MIKIYMYLIWKHKYFKDPFSLILTFFTMVVHAQASEFVFVWIR
jgi:hypothetical protein